jgi:hypothetical protein
MAADGNSRAACATAERFLFDSEPIETQPSYPAETALRIKVVVATCFVLGTGFCPIIGSAANVAALIAPVGRALGAEGAMGAAQQQAAAQPGRTTPVQREPQIPAQLAESRGPIIASLLPGSGPIGTSVTIQGNGFTQTGNDVQFHGPNDFLAGSPVGSENGITLRFIVTPCPSREPQCPTFFVVPGNYSVVVINANGKSNEATFTVTRP